MKALYDIPAPAKLNLFLHITGRRADGYHLLQSAFMLIDRVVVLDYGKKIGDGVPDEVRNNEDVIQAYLGTSH